MLYTNYSFSLYFGQNVAFGNFFFNLGREKKITCEIMKTFSP